MGAAYERDATIMEYYKAGLTLSEIGDEFGISKERVRQVVSRAAGDSHEAVVKESLASRRETRISQGWLAGREAEQLRSGYRRALRLFYEEQAVRLYRAGISMGDISRLLWQRYDPTGVQDILKDAQIDRRRRGQYERTLDPATYPWDEWTRGGWHEVEQGREFRAKLECFRSILHAKARRDGRKVTVRVDGKLVRFCFFTPGIEERPIEHVDDEPIVVVADD